MGMGFLQKSGYLVVKAEMSGSRTKVVRLTAKGVEARDSYNVRLAETEKRWAANLASGDARMLRASLATLVGNGTPDSSPLFRGLDPYPDGWRASVPKPQTLPHYPMVLHRGGYPDGS
jgi:hypothetical protein